MIIALASLQKYFSVQLHLVVGGWMPEAHTGL